MSATTLTLPQQPSNRQSFRGKWPNGGHGHRPKAQSGHQNDLTKHKGKAQIEVSLMSVDETISGRLVGADRYTITVQTKSTNRPVVVFKHAIMSYFITPDAETTENE